MVCLEAFTGSMVWRTQLASAFIPAVPLLAIHSVPESPRWLMKKNRYPQAWKALCRLRHDSIQAARDMYYVHVQLELERQVMRSDSYFKRLSELFRIPRVKRATLAASTVMLAQQLCGINVSTMNITPDIADSVIQSRSSHSTAAPYSFNLATMTDRRCMRAWALEQSILRE